MNASTAAPTTPAWKDRYNRLRFGAATTNRGLADSGPVEWQALLQKAYLSRVPPECLCSELAPVPMYIARLGDTYVLKRCPKTGHMHHAECESHGGISKAAYELYTQEAINERADGKVSHALSVPMSTIEYVSADASVDEAAAPHRPQQPGPRRPTMTLRGFLNLLWEEAGLASWAPGMQGKRTVTRVYWRVNNELADRLIAGDSAQIRVFVPSGHLNDLTEKSTRVELQSRFEAINKLSGDNRRGILLVIGELRAINSTSRNVALRLKGMPDSMPIWTPPGSIERLRAQWPAAMDRFDKSKWAQGGAQNSRPNRLIVIAGVQMSDQGNLQWRYGAAMETTEDFIPIDSQYEARIANALVSQGRGFHKPMRYDGVAATFPDFVLTDGGTEVPMEIYGFSGPEYEARKKEKIALYEKTGNPFWQWDVATTLLPPPFPIYKSEKRP
jgi:hypothetical protein